MENRDDVLQLSTLIGLVYETASDFSLWPRLLEAMSAWLESQSCPPPLTDDPAGYVRDWFNASISLPTASSVAEQRLLAVLGPHFLRAHDLYQSLASAESERENLERVTNRLPLGMAVVDCAGGIVSINSAMLAVAKSGKGLALEAGRLVSAPAASLSALLAELADAGGERGLRLETPAGHCLLWLSRLSASSTAQRDARLLIMAASPAVQGLPEHGLRALFGLTTAEAGMVRQLAAGKTLEEHADSSAISLNTAKTHLKRVFAKFGVRRQGDLLQALYTSPLWMNAAEDGEPASALPLPNRRGPRPQEHTLQLPDGRSLSYAEFGPADGLPVIFMHGIGGSRRLRHPDDRIFDDLGIRFILPERPGSGDSDPLPNRRITDWPEDVATLADHLGLEQFAVLGYSAGTPYALATAWRWPERVSRLAIAAAMPEISGNADLTHYSPTFRMSLMIARLTPSLAPPLVRVMVRSIRKNVYRYIDEATSQGTVSDRTVFDDPLFRCTYAEGLLTGVRQGEANVALEVLLAVNPWGFDPAAIATPVDLWHGAGDHLVALNGAKKLAACLPAGRLRIIPEAGHYIVYSHWREILAALRDSPGVS